MLSNIIRSMKPHHSSYLNSGGKCLRFDIFLSDDFSGLQNVSQVYGIILNQNTKMMRIVQLKSGAWTLPGGSIENGETFVDTLNREIKEETNLDLIQSTIKPLFFQNAYSKNERGEYEYSETQVRYLAIAKVDKEFESDPDDGDVVANRWIEIKDLEEYINWGETTKMIIEILI